MRRPSVIVHCMRRFKSDPERRPVPICVEFEVLFERQVVLAFHGFQVKFPQHSSNEETDQGDSYRATRAASKTLTERFRGLQIVARIL
jgi:hypothetical protein